MSSLLRLKSTCCPAAIRVLLCLFTLILLVGAQSASASIPGSIQSTLANGTTVNANHMPSKAAAYLNGGPQNENSAGLPVGNYYFQVTDPNGAVLLSTDDVTCRQVVVGLGTAGKGVVLGHPAGTAPASCTASDGGLGNWHNNGGTDAANGGSIPIQLCAASGCPFGQPDYKDTPNNGGEYKVWLISVDDYNACGAAPSAKNNYCFQNGSTKTDNFKVLATANVQSALVEVCKFDDTNDNGIQDNGEPFIPHWPITATGVDPASGNPSASGTTVNTQTGDNGCVAFTYTGGVADHTITLTEGLLPGWTATAPPAGDCTAALTGTVNANDTCSVTYSAGIPTVTITVNQGDSINAPNFGNNNCGGPCTNPTLVVTKSANPSFTRTFTWGISKSVDQTQINTSGSATFNYTVSVTHDAGTDSGWQVTGTIRVGNPGSSDISGITVADTVDDGGSCTVDTTGFSGTVAAGSHVDFPYSCTYGSLPPAGTNTATASFGSSQFSGTAPIDFTTANISLVDDCVDVTDTLAGDLGNVCSTDSSPKTFTYSKTFTDTAGTCTTHNNTATFSTDTTNTTGSSSQSVSDCVGADLKVSKTATPTFNSSISKSPDKTEFDTSSGGSVTITYTVTVTESGWQVAGNITVTNPNDWEDISANLSDALSDVGGSCTISGGASQTVPKSGSISPAYTCTFSGTPASASGTNTATATWDKATFFTPDGSASGNKGYTFGSLTVTDAFNGGGAVTLGTITTPTATSTFTDKETTTAPTSTCATINNTASIVETNQTSSAQVKVCGASPLTVSKTATPAFNSNITKAVDNTRINITSGGSATFNYTITVTESGWNVTGAITVSNPNDFEAITASVADTLPSANCTVTPNSSQVVPASGTATWNYTCNFSSAPGATGTNTGTATWDATAAHTATNTASGTAGYTFGSLHVTDSFAGALGTISAPAASTQFTYSRTITAPTASCSNFPNTATITETSQTSNQSVEVCGFSPLTVSKTAGTNYNATVKKTSGQTSPVEGSGSTTLTYTVTVTESGWTVCGNITVTNPNNWESVTVNLADALSIVGGSCSITGGNTQTVPANTPAGAGVISPAYKCTFASAPAVSGNNTAMASWSNSGSSSGTTFVVAGSASSGAVPFAFQLLNVTDQFNGGTTKTLGSNLVPAASYSFSDSYTVTVTGGTCKAFPNVATLVAVGTPPNASISLGSPANVSVTVCNIKTGALTMGFWHNNNGQAIITGQAKTGVCPSATWLRQFNPFQDLSATATCSQVASYFLTQFNNANASGSSMNAMLKAQMLTTALDVYFSDPALGGNKIGAPTPLGGVKIDSTHVCAMIDGSGGTGTCSGSFENASSAFGGATSGTVSFLLTYAASQAAPATSLNPLASPWYGQNKVTQGLAKDTFDAINNQVATLAP